jgi:hypothetical protein
MDIDEPFAGGGGSPMSVSRGTPRRRVNGHHGDQYQPSPRLKQMPVSAGLTVASRRRPALADDEIDRMLDRVAAEGDGESDSEGEIELPEPRGAQMARREGAGVVGV